MSVLRLYSCALVLGVFALVWHLELRSERLIGVFLILIAFTAFLSMRESVRRLR